MIMARRQAQDTHVSSRFNHGDSNAMLLERFDGTVHGIAFAKTARIDGYSICRETQLISG